MANVVTPYQLDPIFERNVIALMASDRDFYARIGVFIEPKAFESPDAVLLATAMRRMYKELGHGPGGRDVVTMGMRRLLTDQKKFTFDAMASAEAYLLDGASLDPSPYISEMSRKLKRRFQLKILNEAMTSHTQGELVQEKTVERFKNLDRIGSADNDVGVSLDDSPFEEIVKRTTGIADLDTDLEGGLVNPGLAVFGGDSKSGKSMAMSQVAAAALWEGELVAFLTTELLPKYQQIRISAALANVKINDLARNDAFAVSQYLDALKVVKANGGDIYIKQAEPDWTIDHINRWLDVFERQKNRKVDRLVIDYADHLTAKGFTDDYHIGYVVYAGLAWITKQREINVYTAAQAIRRKTEKYMTISDFAGSQHKVRLVDLALTINRLDEELIQLVVVADRHCGQTGHKVMPLPKAFERGQLVVSSKDNSAQATLPADGLFDGIVGDTDDGYDPGGTTP